MSQKSNEVPTCTVGIVQEAEARADHANRAMAKCLEYWRDTLEENKRLRALLADRDYIQCKADYNKGYLSHASYLAAKERGLELTKG